MQFKPSARAIGLAVGAWVAMGASVAMAAGQPYAMVTFALQRTAPAAAPVPVPVMEDWLMLAMALLVAVGGAVALRRKVSRGLVAVLLASALILGGWGGDPIVRSAYANANATAVVPEVGFISRDGGIVASSLFEVRTVAGAKPIGTIFMGNSLTSPSFIAQVFGSSFDDAGEAGRGFLGFGSGDGGVFGSSTFSAVFNETGHTMVIDVVQGYRSDNRPFGLQGIFGAPTLGSAPAFKGSAAPAIVLCQPGARIPSGGSCAIGLVDHDVSN